MPKPIDGNQELTVLVPRVKSFTNQYITRAAYDPSETKLDRLAVLVFNSDGSLIFLNEITDLSEKESVTLNKSLINLPSATVVMLANIDLAQLTRIAADGSTLSIKNDTALTLNGLSNYTYNIADSQTVINNLSSESFKGFPMMGASVVDLSKDASSAAVEIGLKILYAKVSFEISVENGTENQNVGSGISFSMSGYTVHNASKATSLNYPTTAGEPMHDIFGNIIKEGDNAVLATTTSATYSSSYAYSSTGFEGTARGTTNVGGNNPIKFTFYVSESRFNHNCNLANIYPEGSKWLVSSPTLTDEDVKGYSSLSAAQKALPENKLNGVKYFYDDYIQHYKPKLVKGTAGTPNNGAEGLATSVTVKGTYTDYRGVLWDVDYKILLGKDNSQNFHVDRNSEYINKLTIKGIRNNKDYMETDDEGNVTDEHVWIDHRVNSSLHEGSTSLADRVTITRETLIDSHIEVRPLRLSWAEDEFVAAKVYLPTDQGGNLIPWIGIERFTNANCQDGAMYCYAGGKSTGKRKYFTSSLITELQGMGGEFGVRADEDGRKYLSMLNGECAWIYFDENPPVGESTTSSEREAEILIEFLPETGNSVIERYRIKQRGLESSGDYRFESFEEYLHSYDSADKYNLSTSPVDYTQQGLAWGFPTNAISTDVIVSATPFLNLQGLVPETYRYDYFHAKDVPAGQTYYMSRLENGSWIDVPYGTGLDFTIWATAKQNITIKDMGTIPNDAYQYCLSKNKFREDPNGEQHMMDIHWYLPDVYELQEVLASAGDGDEYDKFLADDYYWSSQPSIGGTTINVGTELSLKDEKETTARVASKSGITDAVRTNQNRIRCFYSKSGKKNVNMNDRIPDGLGGSFSFDMKGYPTDGYFHYLLEGNTKTVADTSDFPDNKPKYPTKDDDGDFNYIEIQLEGGGTAEGFELKPTDMENWKEYTIPVINYDTGYYLTLGTYPGLIANNRKKLGRDIVSQELQDLADLFNINLDQYLIVEAYQEIPDSPISESRTITTTTSTAVESKNLKTSTDIPSLDAKLDISFDNGTNESKSPEFNYEQLVSKSTTTSTRNWIPPVYTGTDHPEKGEKAYPSATGSGTSTGIDMTGYWGTPSEEKARQNAFENTASNTWNGAYQKAQNDALSKLKEIIERDYKGWTFVESEVKYSPENLTWDTKSTAISYSPPRSGSIWLVERSITVDCTVTLTASVTLTRGGGPKTLYTKTSGGDWSSESPGTPVPETPTLTSDELRMYCGNSFTITCTDPDYEITKVKVHYSGDNNISSSIVTGTYKYARFLDSSLMEELPIIGDGSTHVMGMEFIEDSETGRGTQQWTGAGTDEVTLTLADYTITTTVDIGSLIGGNGLLQYSYLYDRATTNHNKYIIIDKIEVKCTKRTP